MAKSDLSLVDREGNTLLHLFLQYDVKGAIIRFHAKFWALKNNDGDSPFVMLCRHESLGEVISKLKSIAEETKIDLNEKDSRGFSPLYYIINSSLPTDVKHTWMLFADVISATEYSGVKKTLLDLYFSSQNFTYKGLLILLQKQPDLWHSMDNLRRTLLMRIITRLSRVEDSRQVRKSLRKIFGFAVQNIGKNVNLQDLNGDTALHHACKYFHLGFKELKKGGMKADDEESFFSPALVLLVEHAADPNIKNNKGETPLDYVPNLLQYESMFKNIRDRF
jgi:ankyrin repeat protein